MTSVPDGRLAPSVPRPDESVWPGLATTPNVPVRAKAAEMLFRKAVQSLPVRVELPGGGHLGAGAIGAPTMRLVRPGDLFHRLAKHGNIGFGESYMVGDWTSNQLAELLTPFATRVATLIPPALQRLRRWAIPPRPVEEHNSIDGSRRNIHRHYDLSNELFAAFLDETMTYSSAWFDDPPTPAGDNLRSDRAHLATAQHRKIDGILDLAGVGRGRRVLEIGTGWGELAIRAAGRGAEVTSVTISEQQRELALARIARAGLRDSAQVLLADYREVRGSYDAVVSVEMIEAVGFEYWPAYFASLDRLLEPGGKVALQAITMPHDRMLATCGDYTWMHKYIFPGGIIPSATAIKQCLASHTRLRITARRAFGRDYARTLACWRDTFLTNWSDIAGLGFDETFRRMWEFYLAYSEAGFRSGYLEVEQLALSRR